MLPVLFSVVLQPSWAPLAAAVLALLSGAWQARGARVAGDPWKKALQTGALWAGGTAVVLFLAVRMLGEAGNNDLLHLTRPLVIPLHTYGLLIATAFLVAMQLAGRAARRAGLDRERVMDLCFWILLAAMVGSRVLFIIVNWDDYAHDPGSIFAFWKGGLVFYGGFLGPLARGAWWNLSTSELISVAIFALGVVLYVTLGRRAGGRAEPAAA